MELPESMIEKAIRQKQMEMYIQFIVSAAEEKIIAAEALVRWNCPGKGIRKPDTFLNDQEGDGVLALDLFMFELVCRKLEAWKRKGWENLQLSCNFSRNDFVYTFLAEKLISIARRYDFSPNRLIIEITENAVEEIHFFTSRILRKLKDYGFRIALDDFGAGASSIKDIQALPLDILKLDRSLLRGAWTPVGERVFREVTRMGKRLQYRIVCEGVETESEMQIARRAGVDSVQGFLYYTPIPEAEADQFLEHYYGWHTPA